jgi:hypothetical protein
MNKSSFLKILLIIGGIIEIIIGSFLLFIDIFIEQLGYTNISTFSQMAASFLIGYGILLLYSSKDIERYLIIPVVNILIRIIMMIFTSINFMKYPEFLPITIFALIYDPLWSITVILLIKYRVK